MSMQGLDFFAKVKAHDDLTLAGIKDGNLIVEHGPTKAVWEVAPKAVLAEEWEVLERVLTGKREPVILDAMCRVCGYFSLLKNWTRSKIGEQVDRRKGNYEIPEA